MAWDADVDVALTAPFAAISAEHVLVTGWGKLVGLMVVFNGDFHGVFKDVLMDMVVFNGGVHGVFWDVLVI